MGIHKSRMIGPSLRAIFAGVAACLISAGAPQAQDFPSRPVTLRSVSGLNVVLVVNG